MTLHVYFVFPETSQKPLEEVEEIFDYSKPGSIRFLGTPAWKTGVDKRAGRLERGEFDAEDKLGPSVAHHDGVTAVNETSKSEL